MKLLKDTAILATAVAALATGPALALDSPKATAEQVETKVYQLLDKNMTTIKFANRSDTLSEAEITRLRAFAKASKDEANLDQIVVAAWSDKEYPAARDENLEKSDRDLADKRAEAVKKVLKDAGAKDVDTYSFAEHPSWLSRIFNTEQAKLKGSGKVKDSEDRVIASLGKQLRAKGGPGSTVVILKHKDEVVSH